MDATSALADLTEVSSHVEAAAILDDSGALVAATPDGEGLAGPAGELLREAGRIGGETRTPVRVEASLGAGAVLVLRENRRAIVARTLPRPPTALLFHDLAACLRQLEEPAGA